jgi:hypothetical protein
MILSDSLAIFGDRMKRLALSYVDAPVWQGFL